MNREETKMAIAVMQAFVEGQEIECKAKQGGAWIDSFASWNFEELYYRVKPKPREFWVNTRNQRAIAKGNRCSRRR